MLMISTCVLVCVAAAYKNTEEIEACRLHKFQEFYSSWLGTVILEHTKKPPEYSKKNNLVHAMKNA